MDFSDIGLRVLWVRVKNRHMWTKRHDAIRMAVFIRECKRVEREVERY